MQTYKIVLSCCFSFLCFFYGSSYGQVSDWRSFTSVGEIKDMVIAGDQIWSGSNGGVLQFDSGRRLFKKLTNTDGLSDINVISVAIDQHGSLWFALFDGVLNRYFPETNKWEVFEDYKGQIITDVVPFGDSLYVGLDIGVSLFTIDKQEVKETYKNLGLSSGDQIEKIGANAIFISGSDIWVATDKGIAHSSLNLPNLQAPSSWTQFTKQQGLPSNQVRRVMVVDSTLYAVTDLGVARFRDGTWTQVDSGLPGGSIRTASVVNRNQYVANPTLAVLTASGVYLLDTNDQWNLLGEQITDATTLATDGGGQIWIGREDLGISSYDFATNTWELFESNSPASNNFKSLALDSRGRLWCASQRKGVHMFDGQVWHNIARENGLKSNDQRAIAVDAQDRVWVASWGGGVTVIEDDAQGFKLTKIDTANGILAGSDTPAFVVVNGLTRDQQNNMWVLNRVADNTRVLAVHTPDGQWGHFSTNEGLGSPFVLAITTDRFGRIWIGTEDRGIRVLDFAGTLFDKSDDNFSQGLDRSEGLVSNKITSLAEDKDGVMWIGSEEGLNWWFGSEVRRQFGLINDNVNAIGVDPNNNKWIGTTAGVSVLNRNGISITNYTTSNSALVSNNVLSFAFNPETGDVWIGTTNGLSRLQTPFTQPKENLSLLTGYPNPFIIGAAGRDFFTITNLAENTQVRIYDVSGAIVKTFDDDEILGAQVIWDGKSDDDELVASGVYVYLAFVQGSISATGKVAVIRK